MNSFPAGFYAEYLYGIEKRFVSFAKKINSLIFSAIHTELEWRNDSSLFDLIEQIRNNLGEYSNSEEMENFIRKKYGLIDKWSVEKTNEILSDKPFYPKPNPDDPLDYAVPKPQVPAFNLKDKEALEKIPLASRNARLAQNALYREHFEEVEDIINDGIIQGKKAEDITKDILAKVDMNSKRARFWAEDQLANFRTENQILRARKAGFNWYRWKISGIRTRDTHKDNNRKIFSLKVGAKNLSKPGARHPGQDYRCHCEMEFLTDEEVARLGLTLPDSNPPKSSKDVARSYGLIQNAVEWVKNQFGKLGKNRKVQVDYKKESQRLGNEFSVIGQSFNVDWSREEILHDESGMKGIYYSGKYNLPTKKNNQISFVVEFEKINGIAESNFDLFFIPEKLQGKGFAKAMMKTYLDSMQRQGIKKINIYANKDVGGYAWAKFGFMANGKEEIANLLIQYGERLTKTELRDAELLIKNYYLSKPNTASFPMQYLADKPYGKKLLLETGWNGNLDLSNTEQLNYVYDYIEGIR